MVGEPFDFSGPASMSVLCTHACKPAAVSGVASNMLTSRLKGKGDRGSICTNWKSANRLGNIMWWSSWGFGQQVGDADTHPMLLPATASPLLALSYNMVNSDVALHA